MNASAYAGPCGDEDQEQAARSVPATDVVLISMPFAPLLVPSLGLGLLKAALRPVQSRVLYLSLGLAGRIGTELYGTIASNGNTRRFLTGDWLFSAALFGRNQALDEEYVENVMGDDDPVEPVSEELVSQILWARSQVEPFLDWCVHEVALHRPRIVGFTCVYQQQVASLALARRLKETCPESLIVFGGSSCDGIMGQELIRQFPFIDAVVRGEGDIVFPELVAQLLGQRPRAALPGVLARSLGAVGADSSLPDRSPIVVDLDALPMPDLDDFYEQWQTSSLDTDRSPELIFETSRGCWWGQKRHCTFCGFNGQAMAYRSKSAARALRELTYLVRRHPVQRAFAADNILDMRYFRDFIKALAKGRLGVSIFYPVRANLKKEHLQSMRDAGIVEIQPGLESLSTQVLRIMRKGVTALQNIQHLKWCKELGIRASWLFLWGFPGESPEEYLRMADLIPWLTHLDPPTVGQQIRIDRFSPNFTNAQERGFVKLTPFPAYRYVYPLEDDAVQNLAFSFTYQYQHPRNVPEYTRPVREAILAWRAEHDSSELVFSESNGTLLIWDFRSSASQRLSTLAGLERALFLECQRIRSLSRLRSVAEETTGAPCSNERLEEALRPMLRNGHVIREGDAFLSLATPVPPRSRP